MGEIRIYGYVNSNSSLENAIKEFADDPEVGKFPVLNQEQIHGKVLSTKDAKHWNVKISEINEWEFIFYSREEIIEWIKSDKKEMPDDIYLKILKRTDPHKYVKNNQGQRKKELRDKEKKKSGKMI